MRVFTKGCYVVFLLMAVVGVFIIGDNGYDIIIRGEDLDLGDRIFVVLMLTAGLLHTLCDVAIELIKVFRD